MPLNLAALTTTPGLPGAGSKPYPSSVMTAAQEWAAAMKAYVAAMVPPSTAVDAAATALEGALIAAFSMKPAAPSLEAAFAAFAATLSGGMAPAVPVVPPAPVGFADLFLMPPAATSLEGIARVAGKIDIWMRTGTAVFPPATAALIWA